MRDKEFKEFLIEDKNIISKTKAIRSRITKCLMIERHFEKSFDSIVSDDDTMYRTLTRIKDKMKNTNGNISNALR